MSKFLDYAGLQYFNTKLNTKFAGKQNTLTAGEGITISGDTISVNASAPVELVTFTWDSSQDVYTADHTVQEVNEAITAGKSVVGKVGNDYYELYRVDPTNNVVGFGRVIVTDNEVYGENRRTYSIIALQPGSPAIALESKIYLNYQLASANGSVRFKTTSTPGTIDLEVNPNAFLSDIQTIAEGVVDTALADYTTTADLNTMLADYTTDAELTTTLADYTDTDGMNAAISSAVSTAISSVYRYKGSVATVEDLPTLDNVVGDVYDVQANGMNYAWNGTTWDALGGVVDPEPITNAEIDAMMA